MNKPDLKDQKFLVISHVFVSGPAQALLEYLTEKNIAGKVMFIGHPLFFQEKNPHGSFYEIYKNGREIFNKSVPNKKSLSLINYLKDVFFSCKWVAENRDTWDYAICADPLNTFSGIFLRNINKVKKVIYYTVDYAPKRFKNPIFNYIYHQVDKFCIHFCDDVWNLSPRMEEAREKYYHIKTNPNKQKIVPMGSWLEKKQPSSFPINQTLVFMGHLLEKQGVQYVIGAMPKIVKKIPDFKFLIIGTGPYEETLKILARKLGVEKFIEFTGYIRDLKEAKKKMQKASLAIAIYEKGEIETNFTYFADPGKIKDYLALGLPIILSDVPYNTHELVRRECGIVIKDFTKLDKEIINFFEDENKIKNYRQNAAEFAKKFEWGKIFGKALTEII